MCFNEYTMLILKNEQNVAQFILDPSSLNLPVRVSLSDPVISDFYRLSRQYCYKLDKTRTGLLKKLLADKRSSD